MQRFEDSGGRIGSQVVRDGNKGGRTRSVLHPAWYETLNVWGINVSSALTLVTVLDWQFSSDNPRLMQKWCITHDLWVPLIRRFPTISLGRLIAKIWILSCWSEIKLMDLSFSFWSSSLILMFLWLTNLGFPNGSVFFLYVDTSASSKVSTKNISKAILIRKVTQLISESSSLTNFLIYASFKKIATFINTHK